MKFSKLSVLILIIVLSFHCKPEKRKLFVVSVDYYPAWGYRPVRYELSQDSAFVQILKTEFDSGSNLYSRSLTKKESDSIYQLLQTMSLDTLKNEYKMNNVYDATDVHFNISGEGLPSKKIEMYVCSTTITDTLENLIQSKVLDNRFKYKNLDMVKED